MPDSAIEQRLKQLEQEVAELRRLHTSSTDFWAPLLKGALWGVVITIVIVAIEKFLN